jgi:hypothetical protein
MSDQTQPCPDCAGGTLQPMHTKPEGYCLTCGHNWSGLADELAYVRDRYGVPAEIGREVRFEGRAARIVGGRGGYVDLLTPAGELIAPCHPTWEMDYLDGIDWGERYDERVERSLAAYAAR